VSGADGECVPPQKMAASFCVSQAETWTAGEGLAGERSLHPSLEQGFRFPAEPPGLLKGVQASLFPIFDLQFSALCKLLLTHEGAVDLGTAIPFPSALHLWIAAPCLSGFQVSRLAKQGSP